MWACLRSLRAGHTLRFALVSALAALALAPPGAASVGIGTNAAQPGLRVDAGGNAEVSWASGGARKTLLVPASGPVLPGGQLEGADVSHEVSSPAIPFKLVLRSGPGGWYYALQTWPVRTGPVELRFSRWRGAPTKMTLETEKTSLGIALSGVATFGGKPIPTTSRTPGGTVQRQYVYLGSQVGGQWKNLGGVAVKPDGSYRRVLFRGPFGNLFRAGVAGPNIGSTYAPDALALAPRP